MRDRPLLFEPENGVRVKQDYANHGEAQRVIADYIVRFYNGIRLHSKLGYLSPAAYERKMAAIPPIPVSEMI